MKRFILSLVVFLALSATSNAMSYSQAREQALFLTDKMAYELNFTEEQYDAAYEINLDYLMSVNTYDDLYGEYWRIRNLDMSYILLDWQYSAFCAASYFYRPLYWTSGVWHFAIYSRYPRRTFFYFGHTDIYVTYRGGHSWRHNGGKSWYKGRTYNHGSISRGHGMRDRFDRGDFKKGDHGNSNKWNHGNSNKGDHGRPNAGKGGHSDGKNGSFSGNRGNTGTGKDNTGTSGNRTNSGTNTAVKDGRHNWNGSIWGQERVNFRNNRESSTRTTARPGTVSSGSSVGGNRRSTGSSTATSPSRTFKPSSNRATSTFNKDNRGSSSSGSNKTVSVGSRSLGGGSKGTVRSGNSGSSGGGSGKGNFGGKR